MRFSELLSIIENIARKNDITEVFVCGGIPRDRILKKNNKINDIDLTTGNKDISYLAKEVAIKLKSNKTTYLSMPDGHARIMLGDLKLDFSSNFKIPQINEILKIKGINNPTEMQMEIYSRDFTCNALLMSMDLKEIQDPTGMGIKDIKNKIIKTCLSPEITLGFDNRRVARIIYLAAKLQFTIDPKIIEWVKKNPASISNVRQQYLTKKLGKAIAYDKNLTEKLITEMNLWPYIPTTKELMPYVKKYLIKK